LERLLKDNLTPTHHAAPPFSPIPPTHMCPLFREINPSGDKKKNQNKNAQKPQNQDTTIPKQHFAVFFRVTLLSRKHSLLLAPSILPFSPDPITHTGLNTFHHQMI